MTRALSGVTIGIGVGADAVRVVRVRDGRVVSSRERELTAPGDLEGALDELLSEIPRTLRRARIAVAVGPAHSQFRLVRGLPMLKEKSLLSALVQQDPSRFFLRSGTPLVTTGVEVVDDGAWVGAIDQPTVEMVIRSCRRKRWRRVDVVPTAAVLHHAFDEECIDWQDGEVTISVRREQGRLQSCRRTIERRGEERSTGNRRIASTTPCFDGDIVRYADAIAVTQLDRRSALTVASTTRCDTRAPLPRWRIPLAAVCLFAAGILAIAAPGIAAARVENRIDAELARLGPSSRKAARVEREIANRTTLLRELTQFDASTRSLTLSLAALTRAIRPPSMLLSFRADTVGGTLIALTPSAAALVEMLGNDPEVIAPRIVGPVTPQALPPGPTPSPPGATATAAAAPPRTERVTIHFLWRGNHQ
jgi:hypothetical protein